jgi:hypothetical protein
MGRASHISRMNSDANDLDPVIEAYKRDIDRTLLRRNLERTPDERVRALMDLQKFAQELRAAGRATRGA